MRSYPAQTLDDVARPAFTSFLDLARWTAASMVLVGHLRNPMFLGYGALDPADRNVFVNIWYFATGWHAEAVTVFFVLSGFLVGGLASAKAALGQFQLPDYSIDRVTRLFVAFLPALMLTAVLDNAGNSFFADVGYWDHTHPMISEKINSEPFVANMTVESFLTNAAMLQTFRGPPYGSNLPLWTISAEFWFYVVFGVVLTAYLARRLAVQVVCVGLLIPIFAVLGSKFPQLLGLWVIGLVAGFVSSRKVERPLIALAVFLGVLVAIRLRQDVVKSSAILIAIKNYLVAISFMWLLISMRNSKFKLLVRLSAFNRFMADFSYSVYLIHFPLMLFLLAALYATGMFPGIAKGYSPTDIQGVLVYVGMILSVYLVSWVFASLTERKTWVVRRFAKDMLKGGRRSLES